MSDIGVCTTMRVLQHKLADGKEAEGSEAFWTFRGNRKMNVYDGDKLWIACEKQWQGYFIIDHMNTNLDIESSFREAVFYSESWHPDGFHTARLPFRGFTYNVPERESD